LRTQKGLLKKQTMHLLYIICGHNGADARTKILKQRTDFDKDTIFSDRNSVSFVFQYISTKQAKCEKR